MSWSALLRNNGSLATAQTSSDQSSHYAMHLLINERVGKQVDRLATQSDQPTFD